MAITKVTTNLIEDNAINAAKLNISGNGTSGHLIQSDGDGSFSYTAPGLSSIADNSITHDKLENRYTVLSVLGTGSSFALDFSAATTFTATANGNATFTFSNAKQGQTVDLILSGNHTITFAQSNATFNKLGSVDYDGSTNNLIQITCTNDTSNPVYHYSVAEVTSDTTP